MGEPRLNFRLDFLIKKGKVYKFILLFPKTILFYSMLLVCGICHLNVRAESLVIYGNSFKSKVLQQYPK